MKINCLHGYFIFEESRPGEISQFMSLYGLDLVAKDNYYTFEFLEDAPEHSILGAPYLGLVSTKTFEGKPWEVMRENGMVYDFNLGLVVPILSVTNLFETFGTSNYFISSGLILPGSVKADGSRVKSYFGWYSFDTSTFKYSEVSYE